MVAYVTNDIDPEGDIFATFVFFYRSKETLKKMGFLKDLESSALRDIPNMLVIEQYDSSRPHTSEATIDLTVDDLVNTLRMFSLKRAYSSLDHDTSNEQGKISLDSYIYTRDNSEDSRTQEKTGESQPNAKRIR
jgi:hypothetical protein